jgi:hypothetical protein
VQGRRGEARDDANGAGVAKVASSGDGAAMRLPPACSALIALSDGRAMQADDMPSVPLSHISRSAARDERGRRVARESMSSNVSVKVLWVWSETWTFYDVYNESQTIKEGYRIKGPGLFARLLRKECIVE